MTNGRLAHAARSICGTGKRLPMWRISVWEGLFVASNDAPITSGVRVSVRANRPHPRLAEMEIVEPSCAISPFAPTSSSGNRVQDAAVIAVPAAFPRSPHWPAHLSNVAGVVVDVVGSR